MSVLQDKRRSRRVSPGQDGNALVILVAINVILFLILKFLFLVYKVTDIGEEVYYRHVFNWFTLPSDISTFIARPWSMLTYMFTHESVWHLIANMLWLWSFGYILQDMVGNRKLFPIYFYGGIFGVIYYISGSYLFGSHSSSYFFGANASIMAVAIATTTLTPRYRIFPMINGGFPLWILTLIYIIISMAGISTNNLANYATLLAGGGLAGYVFIRELQKGRDWGNRINKFLDWITDLFNPDKENKRKAVKDEFFYKVKGPQSYKRTPNITQERIDKILDKINQEGYHKLTDEEKDILSRAANDGDL